MVRPDELFEEVLHIILRLVLVHPELFENHHPLPFHIGRLETGVRHDVEKDVESEIHVLGRDARPVSRQLLVGRCVDESTDAFDGVSNLFRRGTSRGAFEVEVLDEMRHAGEAIVFEPRAACEHQDQAGGLALRHRFDHEPCTSGQRVDPVGGGHGIGSICGDE